MVKVPQPLQPMFQRGDKVVYHFSDGQGRLCSTVCTVEGIIVGDYIVYYELRELAEVVMENELTSLDDFEEINAEQSELENYDHFSDEENDEEDEDQITFIQNLNFGDKVLVEGYEDEVYTIVGVIIEIYRYENEEWTEVSYELENEQGLCIYAYDEDMLLLKAKALEHIVEDTSPRASEEISLGKKQELDVDTLLDDYNDYMCLYHLFGDEEYKELAEEVVKQLDHML